MKEPDQIHKNKLNSELWSQRQNHLKKQLEPILKKQRHKNKVEQTDLNWLLYLALQPLLFDL